MARARRTAAGLLVVEAVLLAVSLPVQLGFLIGQLWESDDAALLRRMGHAVIPLEVAALVIGILAACAAKAVAAERDGALGLTVTTAVLAALQAIGWVAVLQEQLRDPTLASAWILTAVSPLLALGVVVRLHRRSRA